MLIQALDQLSMDEQDDNYLYAFGRIAEQYGEHESAVAEYAKVKKPKAADQIPGLSYLLAQNRLKAMGNVVPKAAEGTK